MTRRSLRGRLLAAFVLVAVPPLLLLAVTLSAVVSRAFEDAATLRLAAGLRTARERIAEMRRKAEAQVAAVASQDLPAAAPAVESDRTLADSIATRRDLAALEIVGGDGRVISSHHWPAGFGLPDEDGLFPGDDSLRIEKAAEGYGAVDRLALMAARAAVWRGAPVTVRGGPFLDEAFVRDLSGLMGVEVALRDGVRGRWIAPTASPVLSWRDPELRASSARGDVVLTDVPLRWAATPLSSALWLVVATPRTAEDAVTAQLRRLTLGVAGAALLGALVAALVLSARIARPVRRLAEGARRVASGDLAETVEVEAPGEIADLAAAFNAMTTDLRASHERLLQAERVVAWREMARRLAHELKNPLFPIQLSLETLRRALDREPSAEKDAAFARLFRESSDTILEELRSLRTIIEEFSEFARMPPPHLRPTAVNAVVEQVLGLYQARAAPVQVEMALAAGLPAVPADRDLLGRALGNLVANALEAMPGGGTLRVRTSASAGAVVVEVEDTGPGLTVDQRTRLFTPYYTTKKGGTGLGLAIVQGVVSDHGGRIDVRSEPGKGTTFALILPATSTDAFRERL